MPSYVIVGASRGIGYQWLKTLSADPANTVVGTVRAVEDIKAKAKADKLSAHIIHGDLTDTASLKAAAKEIEKLTNGVVDYLIVNGAYLGVEHYQIKPSEWAGKEDYFRSELATFMETNVIGGMTVINALLPLVRKSSVKKITVISSGHGDLDVIHGAQVPDALLYSISKAADNILVAKYAAELKGEGIMFLALSPGVVIVQAPSYEEAPPEIKGMYDAMAAQFQKYEPSYEKPLTTAQSVDLQLKVIQGMTLEKSGAFLSHWGTTRML